MNNKLPEGATTNVKDIVPGMMVKVKGDPVLHKCWDNDIYSEDGIDVWGMSLKHEPRMEYYSETDREYSSSATYDYVHVDCIEYALPPIPPDTIAIVRCDGGVTLVDLNARWDGRGEEQEWPDPDDLDLHIYFGADGKRYIYNPTDKGDDLPWFVEGCFGCYARDEMEADYRGALPLTEVKLVPVKDDDNE